MNRDWVVTSSSPAEKSGEGLVSVFVHSRRTRWLGLLTLITYCLVLLSFSRFLILHLKKVSQLPAFFRARDDLLGWIPLDYVLVALAWLPATALLLYLIWTVVDLFGLQVHLSDQCIHVKNTVMKEHFPGLTGVGTLTWPEVKRVEARMFCTRLWGESRRIRFSPVHKLDVLMHRIMLLAEDAEFETRQTP